MDEGSRHENASAEVLAEEDNGIRSTGSSRLARKERESACCKRCHMVSK